MGLKERFNKEIVPALMAFTNTTACQVAGVAGQVVERCGEAPVRGGFVPPRLYFCRQEGQRSVRVGVVMQKGGNIPARGVELAKAAEEFRRELPVGIDLGQIADQPRVVEEAVSEFKTSFIEALAIVLQFAKELNRLIDGSELADPAADTLPLFEHILTVFGLDLSIKATIPEVVQTLARERELARADKNFAQSDALRDQIAALGYLVEDLSLIHISEPTRPY